MCARCKFLYEHGRGEEPNAETRFQWCERSCTTKDPKPWYPLRCVRPVCAPGNSSPAHVWMTSCGIAESSIAKLVRTKKKPRFLTKNLPKPYKNPPGVFWCGLGFFLVWFGGLFGMVWDFFLVSFWGFFWYGVGLGEFVVWLWGGGGLQRFGCSFVKVLGFFFGKVLGFYDKVQGIFYEVFGGLLE